jgi:hypothetical protein
MVAAKVIVAVDSSSMAVQMNKSGFQLPEITLAPKVA